MTNSFNNQLVQNQKLSMAPKLVEFLKVLQFPSIELTEYIEEELLDNPILEFDFREDSDVNLQRSLENSHNEIYDPIPRENLAEADEFLSYAKRSETLTEHLKLQLSELKVPPIYNKILGFLIESLDKDGYLKENLKVIAKMLNVSESIVVKSTKILQTMDPAGVGARNLKECLLIQLKRKNLLTPVIKEIVYDYFELLIKSKFSDISKKTGLETQKIIRLYSIIKSFNPRPGASFQSNSINAYIYPDLFVSEIEGKYYVHYNHESVPSIKINNYYKNLLKDSETNSETKEYIKKRFLKAALVMEAIEQRKKTVLEAANYIISYQSDFLKKGFEYLKPLTMKKVSEGLEISESTVSRAVNGKFIETPRGTYELKFFFSSKFEGENESSISAIGVKDIIKKIVFDEDRRKPLSDEKIKKVLETRGAKVARRTIAKYREELSILPASMRKV